MSVAFTKEEGTEAPAAYLPERLISSHPNLVTESCLAKLDAALALAKGTVGLAQTNVDLKTDRSAMAASCLRSAIIYSAQGKANCFSQLVSLSWSCSAGVTFQRDDVRTQSFRIVGEDEAGAAQGTISQISPIAMVPHCRGAPRNELEPRNAEAQP